MNKYDEMRLNIFEKANNSELSLSETECLLALTEACQIMEASKVSETAAKLKQKAVETGKKISENETIQKVANSKAAQTAAKAGKAAASGAYTGLVKAPAHVLSSAELKIKGFDEQRLKEYQDEVTKIRNKWKMRVLAAENVPLLAIPMTNAPLNAVMAIGAMASTDPADKKMAQDIKAIVPNIMTKLKGIADKINPKKDKLSPEDQKQVQEGISLLDKLKLQVSKITALGKKVENKAKSGAVKEYTDEFLALACSKVFTEGTFEEISNFMDIYEYTNPIITDMVVYYFEHTNF